MIHKQFAMPAHAKTGDVWLAPDNSFKRVFSRGHSWENVNIGQTHPDEAKSHEQVKQVQQPSVQVPERPSADAQGDGDDGEAPASAVEGEQQAPEEVTGLTVDQLPPGAILMRAEDGTLVYDTPPQGEGVDGNGSPVV